MADELDGATVYGERMAYPVDAGQFAARWNEWDAERRERFVETAVRTTQSAEACLLGNCPAARSISKEVRR